MKQKFKKLLRKKWYFQGFNGTPALLYGPTRSAVVEMPKTLGYGYCAIIEFFEEDKCYFLYAWDDLYSILDRLRYNVKKDKNYLKFLLDKDEEICSKALDFYKKLDNIDISKKSDGELFSLYKKADLEYGSFLSVSHIIEGFTLTSEDTIRKKVQRHDKSKNMEMLKMLTAPLWHSFIGIEHNYLYKIVKEIRQSGIRKINKEILKKHPKIYNKIKTHKKKYFWKNNGYASAKVLSADYFIKEINDIIEKKINVDKKIRDFDDVKNNKKRKEKILRKLNDKELRELIEINDVMFRLHDHRKECITIALHYIEMLLEEIGRRFNVPIEFMRYLKAEEVPEISSLKEELKERRKKSVYFTLPEGVFVFTGKEAENYISDLEKQHKVKNANIIRGSGASEGKSVGIVKVCRGEKEIYKVKEGNILVACMTQPEFLPAIKKAAAIVTDEGGLTCHAAIVSRELGIPCVIGTKIATKVLKDGMEVEVDANNGKVIILEK